MFPVLLLLAACQDNKVGVYNTAPTVSVVSPADAAQFDPGQLIEFYGVAKDAQDDPPALALTWESSLDGVLGTDPPDGDGNAYLALDTLSAGDHVITLTALDTDAESSSTSISIAVGDGSDTGPHPGSPTVVLLSPTDGQVFAMADAINLVAAVTDGEDAYDTLSCELIDVPDGSLWTGSPTASGSLTVPLTLTAGTHALTLNAVDSDGNTGTASVAFEVADDGRPTVGITSPADGASFDVGEEISFRGLVSDDETAVDLLGISWSSDVSGVFSTNPADSSGATSIATTLPAGIHTITLAATDETGATGSDAVVITVVDPNDRDDDGDGWTENAGDCDDTDPRANPDATDICDGIDNDCSGGVNDSWWDSYEANQTSGTAYDCGEVDVGFSWSASSLTLSALTLSDETDEDWFTWDAVDEFWDNVNVSVSATGLPASGRYVLELYDHNGDIVDSAAGSGSLSVSYAGDEFDTDEDIFWVRVYATSWPSNSCGSTYTLTIHS